MQDLSETSNYIIKLQILMNIITFSDRNLMCKIIIFDYVIKVFIDYSPIAFQE